MNKTTKTKEKSEKTYHFISGLPRAGSTLLCNVLAQNPRFGTTHTSGIMDVMFGVRNSWDKLVEFQAHPDEEAKMRVIRGILDNYYETSDKPVIFDKSRGWTSQLGMAEHILGRKAKVLVPVRDVRDVLASFEKLWREASKTTQMAQESANYFKFQTVQGRSEVWMSADQPSVGLAYNRIRDAIQRGFQDRMYFIDFDDFTRDPQRVMSEVYQFLGEEPFQHNFDKVEQVTWEDDRVHGIPNLHRIRSKIEPMESQWPKILGKFAEKYGQLNFWKQQ